MGSTRKQQLRRKRRRRGESTPPAPRRLSMAEIQKIETEQRQREAEFRKRKGAPSRFDNLWSY